MIDLENFKDVISSVVNINTCDIDTIDYMAGVLFEADIVEYTPHELDDLIGSFLIDSGLKQEDVEITINKMATLLIDKINKIKKIKSIKKTDEIRKPFTANTFLTKASNDEYLDPYLGLQKVDVNFNSQMTISESLKLQSIIQKEREKQLRLMKEWEKAKTPLPGPVKRHVKNKLDKITDIIIDSFSIIVAGRELLKDASLKLIIGRKYGLIGRNGIGKSTLLGALVRHEITGLNRSLSIGCVEQETNSDIYKLTSLDAVLAVDKERLELLEEEKSLLDKSEQTKEIGQRLEYIYQRLEDIEASSAEGEAASILAGLGFSLMMQQQKVEELSGGWAMRVALARALFSKPDILCLDEPTNHLDLHAVAWLTDYLVNSNVTCIIVSHARGFLNETCTDIIEFRNQQLIYYRGDYDNFEKVKSETERVQQRQYEAQQAKRDHVQKFIDRFRFNAKRAALVQSRIKTLEKLPFLEAVASDPSLTFSFGTPENIPSPMLQFSEVWYTYKSKSNNNNFGNDDWILRDVDISIDMQTRIAICGVNGSGKTTLLKLLVGQLEPSKGYRHFSNKLRVGFFSQHHVDNLDLTMNAVQQLIMKYPEDNISEEAARTYLGKFGISGLLALEPLYTLSGGQKSRVAISLMAHKNPHILILDEPTNHLDLDAVQALILALNNFEGGVVIVSHDIHMISCVADDILHVDPVTHTVTQYKDTIESYKKDTLKKKL